MKADFSGSISNLRIATLASVFASFSLKVSSIRPERPMNGPAASVERTDS